MSAGGGAGTVTDAFKFITSKNGGDLTITASGSGDTLNLSGIAPLNISANSGTDTITFSVSDLNVDDVAGFATGVQGIVSTELLGGAGINLNYNSIDDNLTISTSGVPLFETDNSLILPSLLTVQGSAVIQGNLTVQGSSITTNSTTVNIGDNLIKVNVTDVVASGGLQIARSGTSPSGFAQMLWNENSDRFIFSSGSGSEGGVVQADTFVGNLSGIVSGSMVGDVVGNASSASQILVSGNNVADATSPVLFVRSLETGTQDVFVDSGILYNSSTNALTTTTFIGSLQGTGDVATQATITATTGDASFNVVLASGTGSPQGLFTDNSTLSFNPHQDMLFTSGVSGVFITGSPTLSLGMPNASYKIQHFNLNNCRLDGGSP